ncbi:non-heme iron oxygenase ferredoxin subunit [Trinickia diaoshuihuensis]|jgi:naphthalene 1,2-dioxygenase system ferredoxin subunit|uniref:non-heme iron oxygenase ferredoxin subunit n=1 Tax=Trinickia diaoshuihuensis TaxID=2292265 RepID=UPI000E270F03|nr:non-heme iron oxygenase ferredoxin subunit [Trinickia diaoshuihuensis]
MSNEWIDTVDPDVVRADGLAGVYVAGRDIALFAVGDEIFATDNQCTHGEARLSDGFLLDDEIECPLHQGRFSVRTGQAMCAPVTGCIRTYPVKIENGRIFLQLETDDVSAQPGEQA